MTRSKGFDFARGNRDGETPKEGHSIGISSWSVSMVSPVSPILRVLEWKGGDVTDAPPLPLQPPLGHRGNPETGETVFRKVLEMLGFSHFWGKPERRNLFGQSLPSCDPARIKKDRNGPICHFASANNRPLSGRIAIFSSNYKVLLDFRAYAPGEKQGVCEGTRPKHPASPPFRAATPSHTNGRTSHAS